MLHPQSYIHIPPPWTFYPLQHHIVSACGLVVYNLRQHRHVCSVGGQIVYLTSESLTFLVSVSWGSGVGVLTVSTCS